MMIRTLVSLMIAVLTRFSLIGLQRLTQSRKDALLMFLSIMAELASPAEKFSLTPPKIPG
jgi:hypothetical protein